MAHPMVKWAGGKSQLLERIIARMPKDFDRYFEPFIGGGAVYLGIRDLLRFEKAPLINDINKSLINMYIQVRDRPCEFFSALTKIDSGMPTDNKDSSKVYYYSMRERYNDLILSGAELGVEAAALLVFINKHCFNGLYRVNSKGGFNVPWNNTSRRSLEAEDVMEVSNALQGCLITCGDFSDSVTEAMAGDFVFFDSPYIPIKDDSFVSYSEDGFTYDDHVRLARLYRELDSRGVYVMETNHNVDLVYELYDGYQIDVVDVRRMINRDAKNRVGEEVIITNYRNGVKE